MKSTEDGNNSTQAILPKSTQKSNTNSPNLYNPNAYILLGKFRTLRPGKKLNIMSSKTQAMPLSKGLPSSTKQKS